MTEECKSHRLIWVDILKGIAIIFVVMGHNPGLTRLSPKIHDIIFSFHIPLFFLISGYLFNPIIEGAKLFKRRFKTIIMPYIFTIIVFSLAYILINNTQSPLWYIFWAIYGNGPNLPKAMLHLWFLPNLFLVTILVWSLFRKIGYLKASIGIQILLIAIFHILGFLSIRLFWDLKLQLPITESFLRNANLFLINGLLDNPAYSKTQLLSENQFILKGLPWSADFVLISAAFFMSGYSIKRTEVENLFHKRGIVILALLIFSALHYIFNDTIDLNLRRYDNIYISTIQAYTAIYVCMYISYNLTQINIKMASILKYIGRYSLIVFIFHSIIQSKVYFVIAAFLPDTAHAIAILPAFAAGVCIPLLLNWLVIERSNILRFWYYAR